MGSIVIKESPESDYYVEWSSIVEAPTCAGTRTEMLAYLQQGSDPWLRKDAPHHPEQRLRRVDETGTSSLWVTKAAEESPEFAAHGYPEEGSWDDDSFIYMQRGLLSRANVFALTRRLTEDPGADVSDLLTPLDDEDEVRPA